MTVSPVILSILDEEGQPFMADRLAFELLFTLCTACKQIKGYGLNHVFATVLWALRKVFTRTDSLRDSVP